MLRDMLPVESITKGITDICITRGKNNHQFFIYPFQSQTVLAYQPHSVLNASDFVESETSNAFDLRSPEDLFTDAPDDLL